MSIFFSSAYFMKLSIYIHEKEHSQFGRVPQNFIHSFPTSKVFQGNDFLKDDASTKLDLLRELIHKFHLGVSLYPNEKCRHFQVAPLNFPLQEDNENSDVDNECLMSNPILSCRRSWYIVIEVS